MCVCLYVTASYIIIKELHNKGGHAAVNTNEEVDASQHHVGCAGHTEDEGGRVHHGGDGPPKENNTLSNRHNPLTRFKLHYKVKITKLYFSFMPPTASSNHLHGHQVTHKTSVAQ